MENIEDHDKDVTTSRSLREDHGAVDLNSLLPTLCFELERENAGDGRNKNGWIFFNEEEKRFQCGLNSNGLIIYLRASKVILEGPWLILHSLDKCKFYTDGARISTTSVVPDVCILSFKQD